MLSCVASGCLVRISTKQDVEGLVFREVMKRSRGAQSPVTGSLPKYLKLRRHIAGGRNKKRSVRDV